MEKEIADRLDALVDCFPGLIIGKEKWSLVGKIRMVTMIRIQITEKYDRIIYLCPLDYYATCRDFNRISCKLDKNTCIDCSNLRYEKAWYYCALDDRINQFKQAFFVMLVSLKHFYEERL